MTHPFRPINDDHAIEQVVFTLGFHRPFEPGELSAFRSAHSLWAEELPAIREAPGFAMEVGPENTLRAAAASGVEYAFLRPDGSPIWAMRIFGPEISVECTRYTRWEKVWGAARSHLERAFRVLEEQNSSNSLSRATLVVQDAFLSDAEEYELSALFRPNELVPQIAYRAGANWHVHVGWFETFSGQRVLNNVNLDAVTTNGPGEAKARVAVLNLLSATCPETAAGPRAAKRIAWLNDLMQVFHGQNKRLIESLLSEAVAERIGLGGGHE